MKRASKKEQVLSTLKTYLVITLGLFVNALAWAAFILPSNIVGGGITGVGALVFYSTGLPVGVTLLIVNAILLIFGVKSIGFSFAIRTIYGIVVLSFFLGLLQYYITEPVVDDRFMSAIIGGILAGASIGLIFTRGGSTGGTEILAVIINKYRNISHGRVILLCDVVIIASSYFIFHSIETIVYGYVMLAVASYSIDMFLMGHRQSVQMFIFSQKQEEIAEHIANNIGRGVTLLNGKGWYTKKDVSVLMVVARRYEAAQVFQTIKEIDPDAFISMAKVMGVYGEGFDKIR